MARHRASKPKAIPLAQPDRSGPSQATLLDIAEQRGLLKTYDGQPDTSSLEGRVREEEEKEALVGRLGESVLWSISLSMLHFTLDVLISHQYGADSIVWRDIVWRAVQAVPGEYPSPLRPLPKILNHGYVLICVLCSHLPPNVLLPPTPHPLSRHPTSLPKSPPHYLPDPLLRRLDIRRLLSHLYHECPWILCRDETIPSAGMSLGVECH